MTRLKQIPSSIKSPASTASRAKGLPKSLGMRASGRARSVSKLWQVLSKTTCPYCGRMLSSHSTNDMLLCLEYKTTNSDYFKNDSLRMRSMSLNERLTVGNTTSLSSIPSEDFSLEARLRRAQQKKSLVDKQALSPVFVASAFLFLLLGMLLWLLLTILLPTLC